MRTFNEIVDRAFLNLILNDRAWQEFERQPFETPSKKKRQESVKKLREVFYSRNMESVATEIEKKMIDTDINGGFDKATAVRMVHYYPSIPVLLWSVGLHAFPKYDGEFTGDFHPFFAEKEYRTENNTLVPAGNEPTLEQIEFALEITMLWHWRTIEGTNNPHIVKNPVDKTIIKIFGKDYRKYFEKPPQNFLTSLFSLPNNATPEDSNVIPKIPLTKSPYVDFAVNGTPYNELDSSIARNLSTSAQERHRALEWVIGEEDWQNTAMDT